MKHFPEKTLAEFDKTKYMGIRAGEHRFIQIWAVVVQGRVIVRSWNDKPRGWYRAFLSQPRGEVRLGERQIPIRGVPLRSKRINESADEAYAAKYTTRSDATFVKGFRVAWRKAATLELVPG